MPKQPVHMENLQKFLIRASLFMMLMNSAHKLVDTASLAFRHPQGSLPCKIFNDTYLDCTHRELTTIPIFMENSLEVILLNNNKLANLTGTPFVNASSVWDLKLSFNGIHIIEPYVFSGLLNILTLDLSNNQLVVLPDHIFDDCLQLSYLQLSQNNLESIPNQALAPLKSLEILMLGRNNFKSVDIGPAFKNLTHLKAIDISTDRIHPMLSLDFHNDSFAYLAECVTLQLIFGTEHSLVTGIFASLTKVEHLVLGPSFRISELVSLNSPLETLLFHPYNVPTSLSTETLQPLKKWNSTLSYLYIGGCLIQRIEDRVFSWVASLRELDLSENRINYLSPSAFEGLTRLESLNLSCNSLVSIPNETFAVFRDSKSLTFLDLRCNNLFSSESTVNWQSLAIPSLHYLNLAGSTLSAWNSSVLQPLVKITHLTLQTIVVMENSPPIFSLRTLDLKPPSQIMIPDYRTTICTFAPYLEKATLSELKVLKFKAIIGDVCPYLQELDISGCITEYIEQPDIHLPGLKILNTSKNKLISLTQIMFLKSPPLLSLDASYNEISAIEEEVLPLLRNLLRLNIEGNKITSMNGLISLKFLAYLNLAENHITHVPGDFHMNITNHQYANYFVTLDLSGNPFDCTCAVEPFRKWIANDTVVYLVPNKLYTCATPNSKKGMSILDVDLDCRSRLPYYLGISIPSGMIVFLTVILIVRYHWHIRYKLFLVFHRRSDQLFIDNEDQGEENMEAFKNHYHAYIAYDDNSQQDRLWVMNDLRPSMEENHAIQLCIKDRDFIAGRDIADEIFQSIQQSHKTILVLTPQFVESEWCHFEMRMAHMRLFNENRDVLILVLLENIPDNKLTMSLRQLLCDKELLKWPGDGLGQDLFWRRLRAEIERPVQVDRRYDV